MKEQPKSRETMPIHSTDSEYGISPVPFEWLSEKNAESFHDQTLSKLAWRGGLSVREMLFNMDAISRDEVSQEVGREETYVKYLKFILAYKQRGEQIRELNISRVSCEPPKPDAKAEYQAKIGCNENTCQRDGCEPGWCVGYECNKPKVEKVGGEAKTPDQPITLPKTCLDVFKNISGHLTYSETAALIQFLKEKQSPKGIELSGGSVPTPSDEEIENEALKYAPGQRSGVIIGAKWLRGRLSTEQKNEGSIPNKENRP